MDPCPGPTNNVGILSIVPTAHRIHKCPLIICTRTQGTRLYFIQAISSAMNSIFCTKHLFFFQHKDRKYYIHVFTNDSLLYVRENKSERPFKNIFKWIFRAASSKIHLDQKRKSNLSIHLGSTDTSIFWYLIVILLYLIY